MRVSHFAVLLKPGFMFAAARVVRADEHGNRGDAHVFCREGEEVYRIPESYVGEIVGLASHREATEQVRRYREARAGAGAASAHISEPGVAPRTHPAAARPGSHGAMAEGFSVRVKE